MYQGERFNSISHLIGSALAVIGTVVLIVVAVQQRDATKIVSFAVYGAMLTLLYVMSTLYHSLRGRPKEFFRKMDHLSIYLLIAGTYTPFALAAIRGTLGWVVFGCIWGLAVVGIAHDLLRRHGRRILPTIVALVMGWFALFVIVPFWRALGTAGLAWVVAGGVLYSIGTVFYALSKRFSYAHAVWHLFVMFGSIAHFVALYRYVALR